jgi:hypothetical protein
MLKNSVFRRAVRGTGRPSFLMAVSDQKWEPIENRVFRMAMLKKPWMVFFNR